MIATALGPSDSGDTMLRRISIFPSHSLFSCNFILEGCKIAGKSSSCMKNVSEMAKVRGTSRANLKVHTGVHVFIFISATWSIVVGM